MDYLNTENLVKNILEIIPQPWGANLIDRVFIAIENDPEWLDTFQKMGEAHGRDIVENSIGFNVMGLSGMTGLDRVQPARSRLIENYTELGPTPSA